MGGGGPVWQEEEGSTIRRGGELLPPLERSSMMSPERGMTSSREATEELRSIILLRKVLPAGTNLAAKHRVAIRDSSSPCMQINCTLHGMWR